METKGFVKMDEIDGIQIGSYYGMPAIMAGDKVEALEYCPGRAIRVYNKESNMLKVLGYIFTEPQNDNKTVIEWLVDTNHFITLNKKFL